MPQFGQMLVLGAGGVLTELLRDSVSLLPPFTPPRSRPRWGGLASAKLLRGFRGRPAADVAGTGGCDACLHALRGGQPRVAWPNSI